MKSETQTFQTSTRVFCTTLTDCSCVVGPDMDEGGHRAPSGEVQPRAYIGGNPETLLMNHRLWSSEGRADAEAGRVPPQWAHCQGFRTDFPPPSAVGGASSGVGYDFDLSGPPPVFSCVPPGAPHLVPTPPMTTYNPGGATFQPVTPQFRPGARMTRYEPYSSHRPRHDDQNGPGFDGRHFPPRRWDREVSAGPSDELSLQRQQDQLWLRYFLQSRDKTPKDPQSQQQQSPAPSPGESAHRAAQLVSQLLRSCDSLRSLVQDPPAWTHAFLLATQAKKELEERLAVGVSSCVDRWKNKLLRVAKMRDRRLRAAAARQTEDTLREERIAEKEAVIDTWRMQQIRKVEDKKKEQELKLAADVVLCEVRKKQADVKSMQDVLRSLEKLRRLRKEAASRKGIVTEREYEEAFSARLEQLRCVLKKRTAVYSVEEKALMVMLEGEQEEGRMREREKNAKKEKERQLQRRHSVNVLLFGDEFPADHVMQPFREYFTQAEHSLPALLQIRRDWDVFVVVSDYPGGSSVPQSWILPDAPSDQTWASALYNADTD